MQKVVLAFILFLPLVAFGQEKPPIKTQKDKIDPKTLESLIGSDDEEGDVVFKSSSSIDINQYLKSINQKKSQNISENEINVKKIFDQVIRSINIAKSKIYFNYNNKIESIKKIADITTNPTKSDPYLYFNRFLIKISGAKSNAQIKLHLQNNVYQLNEVVSDENFLVSLFEFEQKPDLVMQQCQFSTVIGEGSVLYKISDESSSVVWVKKCSNFLYAEKKFKTFEVLSMDVVKDGDLFFNDEGQICGVAYVLKEKTIIIEGVFFNQIISELIQKAGSRLFVGLLGEFTKDGFLIKSNLREDIAIETGDLITSFNGKPIKKDSSNLLKKSYKIKMPIELKLLRKQETIEIKCTPNELLLNNLIEKNKNQNYQKIIVWFDPTEDKQLAEAIKIEKSVQKLNIKNIEWRYYRMNNESLLDWISTVKLIQYLISQNSKDIYSWFIKNHYEDSDAFIKKLSVNFHLEVEKVKEVLNNKDSDEKILATISDGLIQYKINALPAISFENSKSLPISVDFESTIIELFFENGF